MWDFKHGPESLSFLVEFSHLFPDRFFDNEFEERKPDTCYDQQSPVLKCWFGGGGGIMRSLNVWKWQEGNRV